MFDQGRCTASPLCDWQAIIMSSNPFVPYIQYSMIQVVMLKKMLSERGLECKGCTDKEDYIKMVFENQNLPILPPPATPEPVPEKEDPSRQKEVDDVRITHLCLCISNFLCSFRDIGMMYYTTSPVLIQFC